MAKPTDLPEWATAGGSDAVSGQNNVVEPPTAKQQSGWHYLEKMPRNWLNWWMNRVYQWCDWLNDYESTAHTWSATQTFNDVDVGGDLSVTGTLTVDGDAEYNNPIVFTSTVDVAGANIGHGNASLALSPIDIISITGGSVNSSVQWEFTTGGHVAVWPISRLIDGDIITSIVLYGGGFASAGTVELYEMSSTGTSTQKETVTISGSGNQTITVTVSPTVTVGAGKHYYLKLTSGGEDDKYYSGVVVFNRDP